MGTFMVLVALVGFVSADIGIGYHYNPPSSSYGVPAQTGSEHSSGFTSGSAGHAGYPTHHGGNYHASHQSSGYKQTIQAQAAPAYTASQASSQASYQPASGYQTAQKFGGGYQSSVGLNAYQTGNGYQSGVGYQQAGQQSEAVHQHGSAYHGSHHAGSGYQQAVGLHNAHSTSSSSSSGVSQPSFDFSGASSTVQGGFQSQNRPSSSQQQASYVQKYQDYYKQVQQQPAQVFKHFYVHAAAEEPEQPKFRQPPVLPAPQKHYKIIFIKTPTPAPAAPQFIPIQPQNEEKTIVYVLVKKPEEAQELALPKIEQKPPTKPEVFFIKYSDKEDSQHVINNIVNDYNAKGQDGSVSFSGAGTSESGSSSVVGQSHVVHDSQHTVGLSSSESAGSFASSSVGAVESQTAGSVSTGESNVAIGSYDSGHSSSQSLSEGAQSDYTSGYAGQTGEAQAVAQVSQGSYSTGEEQNVSQVSQGTYNNGEALSQGNFNSVSSSQGVPHETYGTPKFRL